MSATFSSVIAIIGEPNVGKSTLVNSLLLTVGEVGSLVAIRLTQKLALHLDLKYQNYKWDQ